MKKVNFFGNEVSKLIIGDNPFNGHSYIPEYFSKQEMLDFHTEEQIINDLFKMEELGINTILPLATDFMFRVLSHYRLRGGKLNFIFQLYPPMLTCVAAARSMMWKVLELKPFGIYLSGTFMDIRFEEERFGEIHEMIEAIREIIKDTDIKFGIGTHHPDVVMLSEKENWPVDFYMACMYNLRKGREGTESGFITGKGKTYTRSNFKPSHRQIMLDTLKNVDKPVIAFKLFAGGQALVERDEAERREIIKDIYETVFTQLKPDDMGVIGIYQKHHDQLSEDIEVFNEWSEGK